MAQITGCAMPTTGCVTTVPIMLVRGLRYPRNAWSPRGNHSRQLRGRPGCFPTGATLAAMPGIVSGLMSPQVSVVSITGTSGAGKKAAVNLLGSETQGSLRAYGVGTHRHTPEIKQNLEELLTDSDDVHVTFTPVLAPLTRGILTTVTAPARGRAEDIRRAYEDFCANEPFLHLLPEGQQPETKTCRGRT